MMAMMVVAHRAGLSEASVSSLASAAARSRGILRILPVSIGIVVIVGIIGLRADGSGG